MKKNIGFFKRHKIVSVIFLVLILAGGYWTYNLSKKDKTEARYVLASVEKGTIISSVSGSGQVSVSNQVDIKPKVSGDLIDFNLKVGQEVKTDDVIAKIDSRDAQKAVRDAQTSLDTAKLELNELLSPPEEIEILQAETALTSAKNNLENLINPGKTAIAQAENAVIAAKDSFTKLKFTQESSYQDALNARQKANDNLGKAYEDSFNAISNVFLDFPTIITDLKDILYSEEITISDITAGNRTSNKGALINTLPYDDRIILEKFVKSAEDNYEKARKQYETNMNNYKNTNRYSERSVIETLLNETLETAKAISDTVKSENNMIDYWVDYRSQKSLKIFSKVIEYQTDLKSHTSKVNSHLSSLLNSQTSIKTSQDSKLSAERNLKEIGQNQPLDSASAERNLLDKEEALYNLKNPDKDDVSAAQVAVKEKEVAFEKLKKGATDLDIRAKKIAVQQKQDAFTDAKQALGDYSVKVPFDGVIASVSAKKGDAISSGTILVSLITKQKIAEITINEVDAAKVKEGQKATITFDAIEGLSITGEVAEIDTLGTVSQGVVTYKAKIVFDTQDDRVKSGMSISTSIITDMKSDILLVPNAAIKSSGDLIYVEMPNEEVSSVSNSGNGIILNNVPKRQTIQVGLANDTSTEITEGLKEGDKIITRTINSSTSQTQTQAQQGQNLFQIPGMEGQNRANVGGAQNR